MAANLAHTHDHASALGHGEAREWTDKNLVIAFSLNVLLSVVEVVAGLVSGSLSLIADAVHNLNDAGALLVALVARRVARKAPDGRFTFGYRRAETIGALLNLSALFVVAIFLGYEAVHRFFEPVEVGGKWMMIASSVAIVVDVGTAILLWAMGSGNLNLRAVFIHNLSDAAASIAVLLGGVAITLWSVQVIDPILTMGLALYMGWTAVTMLREGIALLMEEAPPKFDYEALHDALGSIAGVAELLDVHVWRLDEDLVAFEGVVVLSELECSWWLIQERVRECLQSDFGIGHATIELRRARTRE